MVAVIGATAHNVSSSVGWDNVAGLTAGQDLSSGSCNSAVFPRLHFGLAKSFPGFSPADGPASAQEEFDRPDGLGLEWNINGEEVQKGRCPRT